MNYSRYNSTLAAFFCSWNCFIWHHCGTRSDFRKHRWLINMLQMPFEDSQLFFILCLGWGVCLSLLGLLPQGEARRWEQFFRYKLLPLFHGKQWRTEHSSRSGDRIECLTYIVVGLAWVKETLIVRALSLLERQARIHDMDAIMSAMNKQSREMKGDFFMRHSVGLMSENGEQNKTWFLNVRNHQKHQNLRDSSSVSSVGVLLPPNFVLTDK